MFDVFPTRKATEFAQDLQSRVIGSEYKSETEPNEDQARIAAIHSRQDLVLIYAMQKAHHEQLVKISRGVWLAVFLLLVIADALTRR